MRLLPERRNPLIQPDVSPEYIELVSRRRLGRTNLMVEDSKVGTTNATQKEHLGPIEYAHLRAPLPKDLSNSEIFTAKLHHNVDSYFLMRRSRDGLISATGMFKIAFPWAKQSEEVRERKYLRLRPGTSEDEIAGNVWITPELALEIGNEYNMLQWIRALLDPADIEDPSEDDSKKIMAPPKFEPEPKVPELSQPETRSRTRRSASPSKSVIPGRKILVPRKPRQSRAKKESSTANASSVESTAKDTSGAESVEIAENENNEKATKIDETGVNGAVSDSEDEEEAIPSVEKSAIHATVEEEVSIEESMTVETTADFIVTGNSDLSLPTDPETMIAKAKEMVEEATGSLENGVDVEPSDSTQKDSSKKRKAEDIAPKGESENDEEDEGVDSQAPKRAKLLEDKLRRERVRNRALIGITATLAAAAAIPYFL